MKFVYEDTKPTITDADLLDDMRRVARQLGHSRLTVREYQRNGRYASVTIKKRFGSWNAALSEAGLSVSTVRNLSDEALFDNLREVWMRLGRQPRKRELIQPLSAFTHHPYVRRFGGWLAAIRAFLASLGTLSANEDLAPPTVSADRRGPRDPSLRLRFLVMRRDAFRCAVCGRSPATHPGLVLHVDHVIPWVRGGTTDLDNLQTLCSDCNLGKSDLSMTEDG